MNNKISCEMIAKWLTEGYNYVCIEQNGNIYPVKSNSDEPKTHWGSGLYILNSDATLGDCVHFNYDSSG